MAHFGVAYRAPLHILSLSELPRLMGPLKFVLMGNTNARYQQGGKETQIYPLLGYMAHSNSLTKHKFKYNIRSPG